MDATRYNILSSVLNFRAIVLKEIAMENLNENTNGIAKALPEQVKDQKRKGAKAPDKALLKRRFTKVGQDPFSLIDWDYRTCRITNDSGAVLFEQHDVEAPAFWSPMATNIVASKYLHGEPGTDQRETGVRSLISRVVSTLCSWAKKDSYFKSKEELETFRDELTHLLLHQYAAFNSPVWFNVGVREQPQCSACFILSVDDSMDSLLELQDLEGKLFKYGSGTGTNLSSLRSSREKLSGGGVPSGPVSFMRAFDGWAGVIKSGGKTRRAAKMQILNVDHPDIQEFISAKPEEEKKAWALIEQGYDGSFAAPGGAYDSVCFQNANLSVRVSDEFMAAVKTGQTYETKEVATGLPSETLDARTILRSIAEATHLCGDPGLQFDDTINEWHTCPTSGRINASNPCSEYMHLDNSACNLSSLNLLKFLSRDGTFLVDDFRQAVRVMLTAQDILIDNSSYPSPKIEECAKSYRQLGLGYANLGAFLMSLGFPYDSKGGREWAAAVTALMTGEAYRTSAELAQQLGAFEGHEKNKAPMLAVVEKHRDALLNLTPEAVPSKLYEAAKTSWNDAIELGSELGFRNSQVTVLAPTGTISFMMDCDTTGIEPDISLVKYKTLSDGGLLKLVNQSVTRALSCLKYSKAEIERISDWIEQHDTIEGSPDIREEDLPIFDCAFKPHNGNRTVSFQGHLQMMAAVQPFISGAISKTVNLPSEVSVEEIFNIYVSAWELDLKAVALYRDGSKRTQPLSSGEKGLKTEFPKAVRRHLPDERQSITHKFSIGGLEGYLTVGLFEDGSPGEIFLVVAKEGSTLSGIMDSLATAVSIALQYGVPLKSLVKKFTHSRFEPSGFTQNPKIPMAQSIVDYVFRWLGLKFLSQEECEELGIKVLAPLEDSNKEKEGQMPLALPEHSKNVLMSTFQNMEDAPPCTNCGASMMVRQAGCYVCLNCGAQGGCG